METGRLTTIYRVLHTNMSIFKFNSYHILGIDTSASQKDLLRRSKEILTRLKNDDCPEYDFDLDFFSDFRTEESVKESMQKLQNPKKKIKEYFFWFQIADDIDEKALNCLKDDDYNGATQIWRDASGGNTSKSFFYKKNLAILFCLLLSVEKNKNKTIQKHFLEESLSLWHEIISSDKFWNAFFKVCKFHDEQIVSQELINEFSEKVEGYLSDIYTDIYVVHKDSRYINEFQKIFSKKGEKIEKIVLNPAYQVINTEVEKLELMKVSADGILDKEEFDSIKKAIEVIQFKLNNLVDLELFEDSQTKIMRDRAADAIRRVSLDIHNNLNECEKSLHLLNVAIKIAGTESLKTKIKKEIDQIQDNIDLTPILDMIENGKLKLAIAMIDKLIKRKGDKSNEFLDKMKNDLENRILIHGEPIKSAPLLFSIFGCGFRIYDDTLYFTILFIPISPISRYSLNYNGDGNYSFFGKLKLPKWKKIWMLFSPLIFLTLFPLLGFLLDPGSNYSSPSPSTRYDNQNKSIFTNPSNTSSSANYNNQSDDVSVGQYNCSSYYANQAEKMRPTHSESEIDAEGTALKQRAKAVEQSANKIDTMYVDETSQRAIDSYNKLVNSHNANVSSLKRDTTAYNAKLDRFNSQVDAYNNYLETNCRKVR
jgi:hypothetical protein